MTGVSSITCVNLLDVGSIALLLVPNIFLTYFTNSFPTPPLIGFLTTAFAALGVALGFLTTAFATLGVALGFLTTAFATLGVALGFLTTAFATLGVALGFLTTALGAALGVALGFLTAATIDLVFILLYSSYFKKIEDKE